MLFKDIIEKKKKEKEKKDKEKEKKKKQKEKEKKKKKREGSQHLGAIRCTADRPVTMED